MNINPSSQSDRLSSLHSPHIRANHSTDLFAGQESSPTDLPNDTRSTNYFKKYMFDFDSRNVRDGQGKTLLMRAAQRGSLTEIKMCIAAGTDVNATCRMGNRAIDYAVHDDEDKRLLEENAGKIEIVKYLLKHGATVNHRNLCNETVLHTALSTLNPKMFKLLLEQGVDVNAQDVNHETVLYKICKYEIFKQRSEDIHYGINRLKIIELLLSYGADVNFKSAGINAIHHVLSSGLYSVLNAGPLTLKDEPFVLIQSKIIALLLEKEADLFVFNKAFEMGHLYRHFPLALLFDIYIFTWADSENDILKNFIDSFLDGLKLDQLLHIQRVISYIISNDVIIKPRLIIHAPFYYSYQQERCLKNLNILYHQITKLIFTIEQEHKTIINQASHFMSQLSIPITADYVFNFIAEYSYPIEKLTIDKIKKL